MIILCISHLLETITRLVFRVFRSNIKIILHRFKFIRIRVTFRGRIRKRLFKFISIKNAFYAQYNSIYSNNDLF